MVSFFKLVVVTLIFTTIGFSASRVTVNLSVDDIEAGFDLDVGQIVESYGKDTYFFGAHYLSTDDGNGSKMLRLHGFMENDMANTDSIRIALGVKAIITSLNGRSYLAFPVGGHLDYKFASTEDILILYSEIFFAPAPLSVNPTSGYFESRMGVAVEPVDNMRGFMEWRIIYTTFEGYDSELFNNAIVFGARIGF